MRLACVALFLTFASVISTDDTTFLRQSTSVAAKGKDGPGKGKDGPAKGKDAAVPLSVVEENFAAWNAALLTLDAKKVAALYVPTGLSFLPTLSPSFIRNGVATEAYFVELLKKTPSATITSHDAQSFGSDAYLHTGMYTFLLGAERTPVEARFSYLWKKIDGEWIITHHHSSVLPPTSSKRDAMMAKLLVLNPELDV